MAVLRERKISSSGRERKISTTSDKSEADEEADEETKEKLNQLRQEISAYKAQGRTKVRSDCLLYL